MQHDVQHWIDSPVAGSVVGTPYVYVAGWITTTAGASVSDLRLRWGDRDLSLDRTRRLDVQLHFPDRSALGFQGLYALDAAPSTANPSVEFSVDGTPQRFVVPLEVDPAAAGALRTAKTRKAELIRPLLACPGCRSAMLPSDSSDSSDLVCSSCGREYPSNGNGFNFLPATERDRFKISDTSNISSWGYDRTATEIVERFADGVVLDCGCGLRPAYLPNVVNYEVVDYPTTDVVGVGQTLPFRDDVFDAVFSFAVLEHVTDPFACAQELVRVLKPGGVVFAVVPFLQPFHGYPDHYYNMTSSGLRNLFGVSVDVVELHVPPQGLPIFSLSWILNSYARGLQPSVATDFLEMRVKDLIGDAWTYVDRDFVRGLSDAANEELAATNSLIATKVMPPAQR